MKELENLLLAAMIIIISDKIHSWMLKLLSIEGTALLKVILS